MEAALRARRIVMTTGSIIERRDDPEGELLRGLADAVNVTDGADGPGRTLGRTDRPAAWRRCGSEPILDRPARPSASRSKGTPMGAAAAGGSARGPDDPKAEISRDQAGVRDPQHDGPRPWRAASANRTPPTGRKIGGHARFFITAADAPIDPPPDGNA